MARCERGRSIPNASASASKTWQSCRAGRRPRSIGYGRPLLIFPDDADHHALDDDVALVEPQRLHFLVRRLQPDPPTGLAVEAFDRGPFTMDERNHGLAGFGLVA